MRWTHLSRFATALLLLTTLAASAAPIQKPGAGMTGIKGRTVVPRVVRFESLPRVVGEYKGPIRVRPEAHNPEAEAVLEELKRHPQPPSLAELGQVTLDPNAGAFMPLAPAPGTGFEGITQGGWIPSEPTVAAGPLNIFSAGNVSVTVTDKDGSNRGQTDGQVFFGVPTAEGAISDAQCYYDALRGRFVAICFTQGTSPSNYSNFYLAISQTNDARGAWYQYVFDMTKDGTTSTSNWSDYEGLGVSEDKIAMSAQQFTFAGNSYRYPKIRVIDRALAYSGAPVSYVDFVNFAPPPGGTSSDNFVTKPARNLTPGDATIHCFNVRTNGGSNVTYRTLTGSPSAPVLSAGTRITVGSYSAPPDAVQKGSGTLVATNDCRPTDFYVRGGVLICTWHTSANFGGTVSALRLFRLRVSDLTVLTDETYGAASTFYYYPAVTVDSVGTIFLGFDRSSSTEYPSSYATGKRRADATLEPSTLLKAGLSATSQSRWGDYTGIDNDASATGPGGAVAWYAGQWTKATNNFGTWINKLTFTYGQIAGTVSDDCDSSAATTGDRAPLAGVTLTLKQGATTLGTTVTDTSGNYSFGYLESGTYDVVVTPPAGGAAVDALPGSGGTTQTRVSASDLQVNLTNAQTSSGNQFLVTSAHAAPLATGISPNTKNAGDPGFALTVNGSSFVRCATVRLDGGARATTWVSSGQLSAAIPASDLTSAGIHLITVSNPAPAGGVSNPETLTVIAGDLTPPVVAVTAPVGGEEWKAGSSHAIAWTATDDVGVTAVDLFFSADSGATFPDSIATGLADSGSYAWAVPDSPTTTARIKVVAHDAAGNAGSDSSHADFTIDRWIITASADSNGSITPSGAVGVVEGASQPFTFSPAIGHHVEDVLVDGGSVGRPAGYTFPNVQANHTIAVSFAIDTLIITASAGPNGTISPSGAVPVTWGASQSFTITPATGFHVLDVVVDTTSAGSDTSYTFADVTASHSISASFSANAYTVTANVTGGGAVFRVPDQATYLYGSSVELTAHPDSGWTFTGWTGDSVTSGNPLTLLVTGNRTVTAAFADTARPLVHVVAPAGGAVLVLGDLATLGWNAADNAVVTLVDLYLSRTGAGGAFDSIATGLPNTGTYSWTVAGSPTADAFLEVIAHDAAGNLGSAVSDSAFVIISTGEVSGQRAVAEFELPPVWPNPSRGPGHVSFAVPKTSHVRLTVQDIQGRVVAVLADGTFEAGRYQVTWDGARRGAISPGLYFVRMSASGRSLVRRVVVVR